MLTDTENTETPETAPKDEEKQEKKNVRHRKRKHYTEIRELMEFYFGDANLSKDRFIMQMIKENPFVPLEVFLTFNKLKKLASSVEEIAKSLTNSEILELDEEKKRVKRKTAIPETRDVDAKTLYVESLPPTAEHDWVKNLFTRFGKVMYVSLPKYKKSKKIKEFGFIEFEKERSVEKAVKAFREFGGVLCPETVNVAKLASVTSFVREQNGEKDDEEGEKSKQNEKGEPVDNELDEPPAKKSKTDEISEDKKESESTAAETDENVGELTDADGKKRKRRRKKKKKQQEKPLSPDADLFELKVLPKKEWKRLRNKYLNLQREKIFQLKRQAWKNTHNSQDTEIPKKTTGKEQNIENMNMNFYGASQEENEDNNGRATNRTLKVKAPKNPALEKAPLFNFEPGLIVSVKFLEPCVSIKEFKTDMKQYEQVKYVDVKEGALEAFLRCDNAKNALSFVNQISCAEYNCKIISGDAESVYWKKIMEDREMKLNKKVKIPQKRGREKVSKIISKHIRFGDDGED